MGPLNPAPVVRSLKGDRAFQRLRKGRSGGSKLLSLRIRPARPGDVRVAFVVSKKVGKAVVRNRVRRRLREGLREILQGGVPASWPAGFELLVMVRPEAAEVDYHVLQTALRRAVDRAVAS